jgi:hypothetical protein
MKFSNPTKLGVVNPSQSLKLRAKVAKIGPRIAVAKIANAGATRK